VDDNSQVILDSKEDAVAITSKINSATQAATNTLVDAFGLADTSPNMTQQIANPSDIGPEEALPQNLNIRIGE
jgi:hypothetical protein